jgi:hypothetical protein
LLSLLDLQCFAVPPAKHGRGGRDSKTWERREGWQNMGDEGGIAKHGRRGSKPML